MNDGLMAIWKFGPYHAVFIHSIKSNPNLTSKASQWLWRSLGAKVSNRTNRSVSAIIIWLCNRRSTATKPTRITEPLKWGLHVFNDATNINAVHYNTFKAPIAEAKYEHPDCGDVSLRNMVPMLLKRAQNLLHNFMIHLYSRPANPPNTLINTWWTW